MTVAYGSRPKVKVRVKQTALINIKIKLNSFPREKIRVSSGLEKSPAFCSEAIHSVHHPNQG